MFATLKAGLDREVCTNEDESSLMKRQLLMLGMILLPTLAIAAPPDFNGTWARDSANSDPVPDLSYWMTRVAPPAPRPAGAAGAGGGGQRPGPVVLLTVQQDAKTLNVVDSQSLIHRIHAGQRRVDPHTKPMDTGIQNAEVTARLQADSLVIETTEPFGGMPGNVAVKIKEVWSLSPDW